MCARTRRNFLGMAAVAAASGAAAGCGEVGDSWRFFTDREARTLEAMLAWIIPSDDAPGAREAGVIHYIDRQLTRHFRAHKRAYREGLAALGAFADAPTGRQQEILHKIDLDPARKSFFDLVVIHAMQGFYGNPRHGGNRDFTSWRMLGIPPLPVRGRVPYDFTKGNANAKG